MTRRSAIASLLVAVAAAALLAGPVLQAGSERINYTDINKIKAEGLQNSQVMDLASWLTDVYAPRLTGSPAFLKAAEWTAAKMKEWGLVNVKIEPWVNKNGFERGWTNDKFYLAAVSPERFPIPGTPTAWTPGTEGPVSGEVVMVTATGEAELAAYKGKLRGKWVLTQAAPDVAAYWKPQATRYTNEELAELEAWPAPQSELGVAAPGAGRAGGPGQGPAPAARPGAQPAAAGRAGQPGQPAAAGQAQAIPPAAVQAMMRGTAAAAARHAFFKAEGVLGIFTTTPRGHGIYTIGGNRAADPAATVPAISIAAEHYGRLARMIAKNVPVVLEADIRNTFTPDPPVFNVVGELPGTDKADEIVMLGGHFDTWHASPGATDNAVGTAAMLEALRILKATGVPLRRTVRVGLWGGEEQGLLGSREYVAAHFASRQASTAAPGAPAQGGRGGFGGPQGPLELKPDYDKLSVYFNIDNGTGALRGVYLQGNDAVAPIFREWMEPFRSLGMTTLTVRNTSGTDHLAFDAVGLPGFQFIQDEIEYDTVTHHTNMDTYERLQPNDVRKMATIAAGFAYLAANRDEKLPRKPLTVPVAGRGGR